MSRFLEDTRNKTMTSIRSSFPNGAPTAVVVEGSPPGSPPPPTSQLQPHSQLLSTPLAVQDSIPAGAHNNPGINTNTNDSEQARQNRQDDDDDDDCTVSNNQSRAESPPQVVPTPKTTTKSHIRRPAVQQQAAEPTSSISSSSTKQSPKDVTTTTTKPIPESDIHTRRPSPSRHPKAPTTRLNAHQIFYIFILDGLGAMILSGAINFAIAYAMYTSSSSSSPAAAGTTTNSVVIPPRIILLFHLPNSLAGDAAVTIVLQTVITWLVEVLLVKRDLERGGVRPVGFVGIPRYGKFVRWFCFLDDDDDDGLVGEDMLHQDLDCSSKKGNNSKTVMESEEREEESTTRLKLPNLWGAGWVSVIWSQIVRALVVAVVMFLLLWGSCVGILMALGRKDETIGALGDWVFDRRVWLPQVFKLVLGASLALLETPAFAFFWMVQAGWAFQKMESSTGPGAGAGVVGERGSVTEKEA